MSLRGNSIALVALSAALLALSWAGSAAAKPTYEPGEAPARVVASATGSGHFSLGVNQLYRTFSFTARQHSDGTDEGQAQLRNRSAANTPIHMALNCLRVTGNTATMSGTVTSIADPQPPFFVEGSRVAFTVVDNGQGSAPPDLISLVFFFGTVPPLNCEVLFFAPTSVVENGNVQVRS
jgi:hypothetical protein